MWEVLGRPAPEPQGSDAGLEFAQGSLPFMAGRDEGAAHGSAGTDGLGADPGNRVDVENKRVDQNHVFYLHKQENQENSWKQLWWGGGKKFFNEPKMYVPHIKNKKNIQFCIIAATVLLHRFIATV